MTVDKDYRNTVYCPVLEDVKKKKQDLENEIKQNFPRTKIIYNKVRERGSIHHDLGESLSLLLKRRNRMSS